MEEPKKDIPAENSELLKKLDEIRGRDRLLKIVAVVFALAFLVIVVFAVLFYRKISAAKQAFETIQQAFPAPGLVKTERENNSGASSTGLFSTGGPASSSLTVFTHEGATVSGGAKASGAVDGEKIRKALLKYADRPIVKEFIAELKKDPSFREAIANSHGNNPLKVFADIHNMKGMDKIVAKFAFRPDFMKLITEAMSDPELKPMMQGLPQFGMPPMPQIPVGEASLPAEPDSGSEIRFDPSAINGGAQSAPDYSVPVASATDSTVSGTVTPPPASNIQFDAGGGVIRPATVKHKAPPPI